MAARSLSNRLVTAVARSVLHVGCTVRRRSLLAVLALTVPLRVRLATGRCTDNHRFMAVDGTVYLLHFERPFHGPMQHYVGFTRDLDNRLRNHREGTGCVTTRRAFNQGVTFVLARTWPGTPKLEHARQLSA
jgi:hypothetical protein